MVRLAAYLLIALSFLAAPASAYACELAAADATSQVAAASGCTSENPGDSQPAGHLCCYCCVSHAQYGGSPIAHAPAPSAAATTGRLPTHPEAALTASGPDPLLEPPSRG